MRPSTVTKTKYIYPRNWAHVSEQRLKAQKSSKIIFFCSKMTFEKPPCRHFRQLPNTDKDAPRLPFLFFAIEQNIELFYRYLDRNELYELKQQMQFILYIQNIYRNTPQIDAKSEIEKVYQKFIKNRDNLQLGWMRRMQLEIQMRNKPTTMHVFDKILNKCIQTVSPELQIFIDTLVIRVI